MGAFRAGGGCSPDCLVGGERIPDCVWPGLYKASTPPEPTDHLCFSCVGNPPFPNHGSKAIIKKSLLTEGQAAVTPP